MLKHLWNKRKDKKGFTLVELIVVLIILAILAALLIPALTRYIDKAKTKQIIAETRQAVMAAQTLADEAYAEGKTDAEILVVLQTESYKEVKELGEVQGVIIDEDTRITAGKIVQLKYRKADKICTYKVTVTGTEYDVVP